MTRLVVIVENGRVQKIVGNTAQVVVVDYYTPTAADVGEDLQTINGRPAGIQFFDTGYKPLSSRATAEMQVIMGEAFEAAEGHVPE